MTVPRSIQVPDELDAVLKAAAEKQKTTVQALILEAAAKAHGVEITIRKRGQHGAWKRDTQSQ